MVLALSRQNHGNLVILEKPEPHFRREGSLLKIGGWAFPEVKKIVIRFESFTITCEKKLQRRDVSSYLSHEEIKFLDDIHGFDISAPTESCSIYSVDQSENETLQWTITVVTPPDVSLGRAGWLFLKNSNSLEEQAEGSADMAQAIADWDAYLDKFAALADSEGINWCFCIAPSKELVVPELSPFSVSETNGLAQFLSRSRYGLRYVCPIDELRSFWSISYWGGETHWSSIGAAIVSRDVLNYFGIKHNLNPFFPIEMKIESGDLGDKLLGAYKAPCPHLHYEEPYCIEYKAYENGGNTGQLLIMKSGRSDANGTLLVSGGSSFKTMLPFIAPWFTRTYFLHATGRMDPELLQEIRPTHVLLQNNSRFMINHLDKGEFCNIASLIDLKSIDPQRKSNVKLYEMAVRKLMEQEDA